MRKLMRKIAIAILVLMVPLAAIRLCGFSLLGPFDTWQAANIGYQLPMDIGGPMNLAEEYRWDVPVVVYAFDATFLNYFGQRGIEEVDKAFAILNALPPVSQMSSNLTEFPLESRRINYAAQSLGIIDLKSTILGFIVEAMGLADPIRYSWCLRARGTYTVGGQTYTNYLVIKRNFDPVTWTNSAYVNGVLYTYEILEPLQPGNYADAVERPVDPLWSVFRYPVAYNSVGVGEFLTGLTRDDVGGLRYIYRFNNYNVETMPADVTNRVFGGVGGGYTIYFPTNYTQQAGITNLFGNLTNMPVATGLRPGLEKITFQRGYYDSLLGQFFITNVYDYTDYVITNNTLVSQHVRRVVVTPDILFVAADLGVVAAEVIEPVPWARNAGFVNNAQLNGQAGAGPGVIRGPITISLTTLYPAYLNDTGYYFLTEDAASRSIVWGSFDGSTNTPVIYPNYISIREIERQVLNR
ncbi:MAG: hypothetical protein N2487_04975 [Verrucomicrobiae bacterium]|nr:hypothetical protein [Verrucomicrobiae bacterium]